MVHCASLVEPAWVASEIFHIRCMNESPFFVSLNPNAEQGYARSVRCQLCLLDIVGMCQDLLHASSSVGLQLLHNLSAVRRGRINRRGTSTEKQAPKLKTPHQYLHAA